MHRFFVDASLINDGVVPLSKDDSKHALKVLRLKLGDIVEVCDAHKIEYCGTVSDIEKDTVILKLTDRHDSESESAFDITLFQCLPKTGKMEYIIQKCVEVGVNSIVPVISERCVVKPDEKSSSSKLDRYNKIAYEAAKQSRRGIIPKVCPISTLSAVDFSSYDTVLVPYEEEQNMSVKRFFSAFDRSSARRIAVIVGPEGGLELSEVDRIRSFGGVSLTLGKRILRTETAGVAALAIIFSELEG